MDVVAQTTAKTAAAAVAAGYYRAPTLFKRPDVTVLTQFDAGHGWVMNGTYTSASLNDTTDFVTGTQSAKWVSNGAGAVASVQKTGLTLDLTAKQVRVWFKVDDWTNLAQLELILGDTALSNYFWASIATSAGSERTRIYKTGEWACATFNLGQMNRTGATASATLRAAINVVRFLAQDNSAGTITVHVGRVDILPEINVYTGGVCSLTFDDTYAEHSTIAAPYLSKYGYAGTLFPILSLIGNSGSYTTLTQTQVDLLAFQYRWEIGMHASTGPIHTTGVDGLTSAQRAAEFQTLRAYQKAHGYASDSYAYGNGYFDVASINDVRAFFATSRLASRDFHETQFPAQAHRLRAVNVNGMTLAAMKAEVDACKANNTWLIFVFHAINAGGTGNNPISTANFQALVDYINGQAVPVRTVGEVTRALAA